MIKQWTAALACLMAAGCASTGTGNIGLNELERVSYLRASRDLPMDFVKIQRAVFRHQAACGEDVKFAVDGTNAVYARITKAFKPGAQGLSETLVLGLTMQKNLNTRAVLYSYYTPTRGQINAMYNIVLSPELCPGQEGAEDWIDIKKKDDEDDELGPGGREPGIKIL